MSRKKVSIKADSDFVELLRNYFPNQRSDFERTRLIKPKLEKMIFNKKGSIFDLFFIMTAIFLIFIIVITVGVIYSKVNTSIQGIDSVSADTKVIVNNMANKYPQQMQNGMIMAFVGLCILTLIFAALIKVHWMFLPIYLATMVFMIIQAGIISNIYEKLISLDSLAVEAAKYQTMNSLFLWLPWTIFIFSLLVMFIMYKVFPSNQ